MIDLEGSWDRHIALVEFVSNNSFQSSIGMAPYEALSGRKCRTLLCWTELSERKVISPDLIQETEEKVKMIRERLKVAIDRQKSYAGMKRKDIRYEIGEKVFLKVSPSVYSPHTVPSVYSSDNCCCRGIPLRENAPPSCPYDPGRMLVACPLIPV